MVSAFFHFVSKTDFQILRVGALTDKISNLTTQQCGKRQISEIKLNKNESKIKLNVKIKCCNRFVPNIKRGDIKYTKN